MDTDFPPDVEAIADRQSAQVIQIDSSKHVTAVAVCAAICGLSMAVALWAGYQAQLLTTEYRIAVNHSMELEAKQKQMISDIEEIKHGH